MAEKEIVTLDKILENYSAKPFYSPYFTPKGLEDIGPEYDKVYAKVAEHYGISVDTIDHRSLYNFQSILNEYIENLCQHSCGIRNRMQLYSDGSLGLLALFPFNGDRRKAEAYLNDISETEEVFKELSTEYMTENAGNREVHHVGTSMACNGVKKMGIAQKDGRYFMFFTYEFKKSKPAQ